jgi:hypothetical protein
MTKRRPDPRVVRSALPPLCRVKGKPANAKLRLACVLEHCDKCDEHPLITLTTPGEGTIERYCATHWEQRNMNEYEKEMLDFVLSNTSTNPDAWWHKVS